MDKPSWKENKLIAGRYKIQNKLGEGATAVVYKAFDKKMKRPVALKVIPGSEKMQPRVKREIITVSNLDQPNIVTTHDFFVENGFYVVVMEYVRGVTLRRALKRRSTIPWPKAVYLTYQVAQALEKAHQKQVIHRDVKPENILITKDGRIKLTDFGIATLIARTGKKNKASGTLGYMSPEQVTGRYVDETSDIFSLGIVLYEMLTGKNPFYAENLRETGLRVLNYSPPPPGKLNPGIPSELNEIVMQAIGKDPEFRFQSMTQFKKALSRLQKKHMVIREEAQKEASSTPDENQKQPKKLSRNIDYRFVFRMSVFLASLISLLFFILPFKSLYSGVSSLIIPFGIVTIAFLHPPSSLWIAAAAVSIPVFSTNMIAGGVLVGGLFLYVITFSFGKRTYYSPIPFLSLFTSRIGLFPITVFVCALSLDIFAAFLGGMTSSIAVVYLKSFGYLNSLPFFLNVSSINLSGGFEQILSPLISSPSILFEVMIWGVVAAAGAATREGLYKRKYAPQIALLVSLITCLLSYQFAGAIFNKPLFSENFFALLIPGLLGAVVLSFLFSIFEVGYSVKDESRDLSTLAQTTYDS